MLDNIPMLLIIFFFSTSKKRKRIVKAINKLWGLHYPGFTASDHKKNVSLSTNKKKKKDGPSSKLWGIHQI